MTHVKTISSLVSVSSTVMTLISFLLGVTCWLSFSFRVMPLIGFTMGGEDVDGVAVARDALGDGIDGEMIFGVGD